MTTHTTTAADFASVATGMVGSAGSSKAVHESGKGRFEKAGIFGKGAKGRSAVAETGLPYHAKGLAPHLSVKAVLLHHGSHHAAYLAELERLAKEAGLSGRSVEDIARAGELSRNEKLLHCACQVINHDLYWNSMCPDGGGKAEGELLTRIEREYGNWDHFRSVFIGRASNRLWAGWMWLICRDNRIELMHSMGNDTPLLHGAVPLLALDLWELAYHADYGDNRRAYATAFFDNLADWKAASARLAAR